MIILGFACPKNKIVTYMSSLFMFYSIAYRNDGIDYGAYANEYELAIDQGWGDVHYAGWLLFEKLGLWLGLEFDEFVIFISFICVVGFVFAVKKLTKNVNFVLSLFFVYPYGHETIQMRTFLADVVVLNGLSLVVGGINIRNGFKFYVSMLVASFVHFLVSIYVVVVSLVISMPRKYGKGIVILFVCLSVFLFRSGLLNGLLTTLNSRVEFWLSSEIRIGWIIPTTLNILLFYIMLKCNYLLKCSGNIYYLNNEMCYLFTLSLLALIPFFFIDITFIRLWRVYLVLMFAMLGEVFFLPYLKKVKINLLLLLLIWLGVVCVYENEFNILNSIFVL